MPLHPVLAPDGYVQGHGVTYRRTWEHFDEPFGPPEPPGYVPSGPYSKLVSYSGSRRLRSRASPSRISSESGMSPSRYLGAGPGKE